MSIKMGQAWFANPRLLHDTVHFSQLTCQAAWTAALNSPPIGQPSSAPTSTYVVDIR